VNLAYLLLNRARACPHSPAVSVGERPVWTYAGLAARTAAIAGALRTRFGLVPGERVALAMRNTPEFFAMLFACWHAGLCAVPVNAKLHARELAYILEDCGARLCVATPELASALAPHAPGLSALQALLSVDDDAYAALGHAEPAALADVVAAAPAWLFYTSGTTGRPKGAVLSHRSLLFMTHAYYADIDQLDGRDHMLHFAPLSHGAGLFSLAHLARGAHQVIPESASFDPAEFVALVNRYGRASLWAAPTMITRVLAHADAGRLNPARLRTLVYGGGPMYLADLERALDWLGPRLAQIYGQGESPMTITALDKAMHAGPAHARQRARLASCGTARTGVAVRVVDEDGRDCPAGEVGEVVTRSDCLMSGYWARPDATARALRDGWLWTGDLGFMDDAGFVTLKDRSKDVIISGGINIYPREVEEVLLTHPGVAEVAVVGEAHPDWGEQVAAFVVAAPGGPEPDERALDALCLQRIARFKRPRRYVRLDALPKNNYGKVVKTDLRARLTPR